MQIQRPHAGGGEFDAVWTNVMANGAITKNMFVIWDVSATGNNLGYHVIACTDASQYGVGVAIKTVVAGDRFLAQCYGTYKGALTNTSVAGGNQLECAASGAVKPAAVTTITASAGVLDKVGVALATDVGSAGDIFIRCM